MRTMNSPLHKGQSTIEYILLCVAVLAVVILFAIRPNAELKTQLNATYDSAASGAMCSTQQLFCALSNSVP